MANSRRAAAEACSSWLQLTFKLGAQFLLLISSALCRLMVRSSWCLSTLEIFCKICCRASLGFGTVFFYMLQTLSLSCLPAGF